jgi:LysR family glycine cleavage system transcriptional activator
MFNHLPSLKALHAFESAARHGSFMAAAEELAVSAGAVSYQIKQLESSLGTRLFERRTRHVVLTGYGEKLFATIHRQLQELDTTIGQIAPARSSGSLTVSVSTYFVTRWLSPRMGRFITEHPNIVIRLQHSVNDPGFTPDQTDIAIKWGDGQWTNSHSELLLALPMMAVCAPSLKRGRNALTGIDQLHRHTLLRDQDTADLWNEWLVQAGRPELTANGPVIVDPNVRVQAAIDKQGLILANPLINDLIKSRQLCEPFNHRLEGYGYYLVYNQRMTGNRVLTAFKNWLQNEASLPLSS